MRATAVPVDDENVRWHNAHRIRWTPVRAEPQRDVLLCWQYGQMASPSRRLSIAPIACMRASSERSADVSAFSCGPVRLPSSPRSLRNDLASMITLPSNGRANPRTPFRYQNKAETTRFADMAIHFGSGSEHMNCYTQQAHVGFAILAAIAAVFLMVACVAWYIQRKRDRSAKPR